MESLTHKLKELNIEPIDRDVRQSGIILSDLGGDDGLWDYYKRYGNQVMLYSESFIEEHTLKELKRMNKINEEQFGLTLKSKVKHWIDRLWFRYGW